MIARHFANWIDDLSYPLRELSPRREFLAFLLIVAETMIVYVFAGTLLAELAEPHTPLPIILIFLVLYISRLVPHLLNVLRVWSPQYEAVLTVVIVSTMLLVIRHGAFPSEALFSIAWLQGTLDALILRESDAIRSVWMLIIFVAIAWWRGKTRAEPNLETSYTMLRLGMVWLAAGLIFTVLAAPEYARIFDQIHAVLIGFITFTLLAIALARQPEGDRAAAWNTSLVWIVILVLPILLISGAAVTTTGILTQDTLQLFVAVLSPVFWVLKFLVQALVLTIAIIAFILISPVIWLLEQQGFGPMENFPEINLNPGAGVELSRGSGSSLEIENPARYLIAGVILLGIILFLIRFAFRRRRQWEDESQQQHESLIEWNAAPAAILRGLQAWILRQMQPVRAAIGPAGDEWAATRRIRQVYRRYLQLNEKADLARQPEETPNAYAVRVGSTHQERIEQVRLITATYNQARYSGEPAESQDADVAEAALDSFRQPKDD
jgi:hypothetical protein